MKSIVLGVMIVTIFITIAIAFDSSTSKDAAVLLMILSGILVGTSVYINKNV